MYISIDIDMCVTYYCELHTYYHYNRQYRLSSGKLQINVHIHTPGAYEPLEGAKEHETCTTCRVPSQSKFIAKYFPYKESEILLFEAVYGMRVTTKQQ